MTADRILVLSLSPALDRTLRVATLRRGAVHRPDRTDERAGGKGANVVRTLHRHGVPATLVTPLGGVQGESVRSLARAEGLDLVDIADTAPTRVCTTIVDDCGATSFYERSGPLAADTWAALMRTVKELLPASTLVLTGSIPPGLPPGALTDLTGAAQEAATPVWADVSGASLLELARCGASVWPNLFEARQALGTADGEEPVSGASDGAEAGKDAACALVALGAAAAVVSCGADGVAIALKDGTTARVPAVPATVVNPVGAGDVLLGATLARLHAWTGGACDPQRLVDAAGYGVSMATLSCQTLCAGDLPDRIPTGARAPQRS